MKIISIFENIASKMKQTTLIYILLFSLSPLLFGQTEIKKDSIQKDSVQHKIKKDSIPKIKTVFIDENSLYITKREFNEKCNAAVFQCKRFELENIIAYRVYYRMYFGKLKPEEYNQLRLYLNKKSNKTIPENHKILIHYEESLVGFKESNEHCNLINAKSLKDNYEAFNLEAELNGDYPFESIKEFQRYVRIHRLEFHDEAKFNEEVANYATQQNNCIKKVETKYLTPVFYVVYDNYNYPIKNKHFNWVVDKGTIKSAFIKKLPDADFILVKPNGEYFIKSDFMPDFVLKKLLKHENWEQFKQDCKKSIKTNSSTGYGIVHDMTREHEFYTSNCY